MLVDDVVTGDATAGFGAGACETVAGEDAGGDAGGGGGAGGEGGGTTAGAGLAGRKSSGST
jgi:hypothetical protein